MYQREASALLRGIKIRRGVGVSLKEERVASEEGIPPLAPKSLSEVSIFQDRKTAEVGLWR